MPRRLFDEEGNAIEGIPDEAELKDLQESKNKLTDAEKRISELSEEVNPNYKALRDARKAAEERAEAAEKKLKESGVASGEEKPMTKEEMEAFVDSRAEQVAMNRYRDRQLSQYGEKRTQVEGIFNRLAVGEKLNEDRVDELMDQAAAAAGIQKTQKRDPLRGAMNFTGGPPRLEETKEKDFADSDEGKGLASAMGLSFAKIKPKK